MAVYQEKDKKKWTKDGRSWYYLCYYTNIYGERKQKESKKYLTKKDAKMAEAEFIKNDKSDSSNYFFEELKELYLEEYKTKNKYETYLDTKNRIEKHITPICENIKVNGINIKHFEVLKKNIANLDIKTKNSIITYFKAILQFGVDNYDLDIPVLPKIKPIPKGVIPPKKYNVWNIEEFTKFINVVDNTMYKALFTLLYFTGLRIGEALALNWNDINTNVISISKSCNKRGKKITTPKTSNSYREVDIPEIVINALKDLYNSNKKIYGFNNNFYIFGGISPISRTTLTRYKNKHIEIADVKKITIHEFRHSHVTLLRKLKYDVKQIANRIGDTETTVMNTYSHLFEEDKYVISQGLNKLSI